MVCCHRANALVIKEAFMPAGLSSQTDDHYRVRRLGVVLSIAFSVLALGLILGFTGTSLYVSRVELANRQLDLVTRHQGETHDITTLALAIDDTPSGIARNELLARLTQVIDAAEVTLQQLLSRDQEIDFAWFHQGAGSTLRSDSQYAVLYSQFLQQTRAYADSHQPGSLLADILGDHHQQINGWSLGALAQAQKEILNRHQIKAHDAVHELWIFNVIILFTATIMVIFIASIVLRRLLFSAHQAVKVTANARDRLAAIIDNIDDGILELTPQGDVCFVNRSARRTLGLRDSDLDVLSLHDLTTFAGKDGQAISMALVERQHASAMAVLLRRPDGSCFRAAVTLTMLGDDGRAILTFRDITRHLHREERLRKLSHAVEYSPAQVIITDFTGVIEYVNPSFSTVTGWGPSEVVGRSPRMLSSGAQSPGVYRDMWSNLRAGEPWRGEFRNRRKDGSSYWVRASIAPIKDENGAITHYVAVQEDVTKEIQALRDLETNRRRLREAVSSLPHGFAIYDADERLSMCNSAYRTMYSQAADAIKIGTNFVDILRAGFKAGQFDGGVIHDAECEQEFIKDRLDLFRSGGALEIPLSRGRWVLATETLTPSGEHVCLRTDITQIKAIQRELETARAAADQANTAKSQFLSSMSHELRTPLNAILGFAQLLQLNKKAPLSERQADQVQQILSAGHHLLTLIDEILDLAKIEAGRASLSLQAIDSHIILDDCDSLIRHSAEQAGLTMITQVSGAQPIWVLADYTRLKQILLNLLSNAVKYNSAEGTLWLSVRSCSFADCAFDGVEFAVSDTGEGIPAEKRDELFKPFNRLGRENTSVQGTGIGLALTHQLIIAMDGVLLVEDRPGGGSQFIVRLPGALPPQGSLEGATAPPILTAVADKGRLFVGGSKDQDWEFHSGCVLYIGGSQERAQTISAALALAPEVVFTQCESLERGLEIIDHQPVVAVLVDISNENDTDLGGVVQLGSHPKMAGLPVAALTSGTHPSFYARLRRLGFAAVLPATPDSQQLFDFLAPFLRDGEQDISSHLSTQ
jgi:PAS domain S-box-containing protein